MHTSVGCLTRTEFLLHLWVGWGFWTKLSLVGATLHHVSFILGQRITLQQCQKHKTAHRNMKDFLKPRLSLAYWKHITLLSTNTKMHPMVWIFMSSPKFMKCTPSCGGIKGWRETTIGLLLLSSPFHLMKTQNTSPLGTSATRHHLR
jgi:hypothetical protein